MCGVQSAPCSLLLRICTKIPMSPSAFGERVSSRGQNFGFCSPAGRRPPLPWPVSEPRLLTYRRANDTCVVRILWAALGRGHGDTLVCL